ncbi:S-adenosyl-L-methionine-dependent methyltransferase [Xylariaceae sp. FL1272]|nr:S-adenosyl-L-methionine-dependent methyltransferase [Xylariaceae sp. FL1272]
MSKTSRIVELSARIAANTAKIDHHLVSASLPSPSFAADTPPDLFSGLGITQDVKAARQAVLQDTLELRNLLLSPQELLFGESPTSLISRLAMVRFDLPKFVPLNGEIALSDLAARTSIGEKHLRKIIRHAIAQHIFYEPRPEFVAHTASSKLLVDDPDLAAWLRWGADECWRAAAFTCDAIAKWPDSEEPNECGFSLAHGTNLSLFDFIARDPERGARFAAGMRLYARRPDLDVRFVVEGWPWGDLPRGATVVDVGGSHGEASIAIARSFPSIKFVVQDIDGEVTARKPPADVADRIRYTTHDFFKEQPEKRADVYLLRAVLHNWSDKYAIRILRSLIPALVPGARIVLNDVVMPGPKSQASTGAPAADLSMMMLFNSGDRELHEWESLFQNASPGFKFQGGKQPEGSGLWILSAVWEKVEGQVGDA